MVGGWKPTELSPLALAFIGDAIWEVYARNHCLAKGIRKPGELHRACTKYVRASAQARLADWLQDTLEESERAVLRRGRNAKSLHTRKSADVLEYRHSTGFETLIGYLYGTQRFGRLDEIAQYALHALDERDGDVL